MGMVKIPTIYGDDWGMVYYCYYTHMNGVTFHSSLHHEDHEQDDSNCCKWLQ